MKWPQTNGSKSGSRGFTLLEILMATLVFTVVLAALNTAFFAAFQLRAQTTKLVENTIPLNQAASIIKHDLQGILVSTGLLSGALTTEPTVATANSRLGYLEMFTTTGITHEQRVWGEMQKVAYYLKEPEFTDRTKGFELVRGVTRNLLTTAIEDLQEMPLIAGVQTLEFAFYDGETWLTTWDSTTQETPLPLAIRMTVQLQAAPADRELPAPLEFLVPILTQAATNQTASTGSTNSQGSSGTPGGTGGPTSGGASGGTGSQGGSGGRGSTGGTGGTTGGRR